MIKRFIRPTAIAASLVGLTLGCTNCASNKPVKQVEKTSYYEVTKHLDKGGDFYFYMSSEKIMESAKVKIKQVGSILKDLPKDNLGSTKEDIENVSKCVKFVEHLFLDTGITEISGIGMSSIAYEPNYYHSKMVIHHHKDQNKGLLWSMFGEKPHEIDGLKMLPKDTAFAAFADFKAEKTLTWVRNKLKKSGIKELAASIDKLESGMKEKGYDLAMILSSLNGSGGIVMTLDSEKTFTIPVGNKKIKLPQTALAMAFSVKDDHIFNLIAKELANEQNKVIEKNGVKRVKIPMPKLGIGIDLNPQIIQTKGYVFVVSNDAIFNDMMSAWEKGDGFVSTDEFKRLSKNVPLKGNAFEFVSEKFSKTMIDIQKKAMSTSNGMPKGFQKAIFDLITSEPSYYFGVFSNTKDGFIFTANSNISTSKVLLIPTVACGGAMAGMLLPAISSARRKARLLEKKPH